MLGTFHARPYTQRTTALDNSGPLGYLGRDVHGGSNGSGGLDRPGGPNGPGYLESNLDDFEDPLKSFSGISRPTLKTPAAFVANSAKASNSGHAGGVGGGSGLSAASAGASYPNHGSLSMGGGGGGRGSTGSSVASSTPSPPHTSPSAAAVGSAAFGHFSRPGDSNVGRQNNITSDETLGYNNRGAR